MTGTMVLTSFARPLARQASNRCLARTFSSSPWADYAMAPADPIIGLADAYAKDDFPKKVIVGVGAYRDDLGKPCVLDVVRKAEQLLMSKSLDHEYSGIVSSKVQ